MIPFWLIYSYWVFALTILWSYNFIKWSPLISAILAFIASAALVISKNKFNQTNIFILATHLVPIWVLRYTKIDILPNLLVFTLYNLVLTVNGTDYIKVYKYIFNHMPDTIHDYLSQRGFPILN